MSGWIRRRLLTFNELCMRNIIRLVDLGDLGDQDESYQLRKPQRDSLQAVVFGPNPPPKKTRATRSGTAAPVST